MEEEKKEVPGSALEEKQAGAYSSQWQGQLEDTIAKFLDRKDFSYDLNGDALYQQYKDRYIQGGQMAMMDTLGQAAALTGGYGSSYAQSAGQQAYQSYLQGLNDKIPELYQLALERYDREADGLYKRYAMLGEREGADYDRYQQGLDREQQTWENAFRLYQQGVQTPEVLEILGIPMETAAAGGGNEEAAVRRKNGSKEKTVEEIYREKKQGGASTKELDSFLRKAIADNKISNRGATQLRDTRW